MKRRRHGPNQIIGPLGEAYGKLDLFGFETSRREP